MSIEAAIGLLVKPVATNPPARAYIGSTLAVAARPVTGGIEAPGSVAAVFRAALGLAGEGDAGVSALRREMAKLPKAVAQYIRAFPAFTVPRGPLTSLRSWLGQFVRQFRARLAPEPEPTNPLGSTPRPALATINLSSPKPPPSPLGRRRSPRAPPLEPSYILARPRLALMT